MDKATQTMIENLHRNTGKTLEQWIAIVKKENFAKHGEIIKFLKDKHSLTHGFANLIAHKAKGSDADSAVNKNDLFELRRALLHVLLQQRDRCRFLFHPVGVVDDHEGDERIKEAVQSAQKPAKRTSDGCKCNLNPVPNLFHFRFTSCFLHKKRLLNMQARMPI